MTLTFEAVQQQGAKTYRDQAKAWLKIHEENAVRFPDYAAFALRRAMENHAEAVRIEEETLCCSHTC